VNLGKPTLEEALRAVADEGRGQLGARPDLETLRAYREGRLSEEAVERVRDWLAVDPQTVRDLADLAAFEGEAAETVSTRPAWTAFRRRLEASDSRRPPVFRRLSTAYALAAVFFVAAALQIFWRPDEPGFRIIDDFQLLPTPGEQTRSATGTTISIHAAEQGRFLFMAPVPFELRDAPFRFALINQAGETVFEGAPPMKGLRDHFMLLVRRDAMPFGVYRLVYYSEKANKPIFSDRFSFEPDARSDLPVP